jgi:hypothetical protein
MLEIDPVQMVGFNEAQRDFILRVMAQSIRVPSVKDITEAYAKELVDLAGPDVEVEFRVARPGVRRT